MKDQIKKLTIITREDISDGYKVAQTSHAVADFAYDNYESFIEWKEDSNYIICLSAKNEFELLKLNSIVSEITKTSLFFEPDINEYTSFSFVSNNETKRITSRLSLILKNKKQHEK